MLLFNDTPFFGVNATFLPEVFVAKKLYDLAVATREYRDRDGNTRTNWLTVGVVMEKDDGGRFIILNRTFNPAGVPNTENRDTLILSMFKPNPRDGQATTPQGCTPAPSSVNPNFDDEIPF